MNDIITIKTKENLDLDELESGEVHRIHMHLTDNSLGVPWRVPVIVVKGVQDGPVLGITAAVHGNELNGISTIFKLIEEVDPKKLKGCLVLVPISNVPGFLKNQRYFSDNVDLNRIMPGAPSGSTSSLYAYYFLEKIVKHFDLLLDLHTASHGRVNSLYLRADLENEATRILAFLQNPQIIVQKDDGEGTLRGWANDHNIPAITVEIGNPNAFQPLLVDETLDGIINTLRHYEMLAGDVKDLVTNAIVCDHSYWIYSTKGGIVEVLPSLADTIKKGQLIAKVYDVFGQVREQIYSNRHGVVIGKNVLPNCDAGTRILHIGVDLVGADPELIPGHEEFTGD